MEGIRIRCNRNNNIKCAGYAVLMADTGKKLQRLMGALNEACKLYALKTNNENTEVIGIPKRSEPLNVSINLGEVNLREVNSF